MTILSQLFSVSLDAHTFDLGSQDIRSTSNASSGSAETAQKPTIKNTDTQTTHDPASETVDSAHPETQATVFRGLDSPESTWVQYLDDQANWKAYIPENEITDEPPLNVSATLVPQPSLCQRNRQMAERINEEIEDRLRKLDQELKWNDTDHTSPMSATTSRPVPTFTWSDTFSRWSCRVQGTGAALTNALGWTAVAAGIPYITSWFTLNPLANVATVAGGGYLIADTLRNIPKSIRQETAARLMRNVMPEIIALEHQRDQLIQEETARQKAKERVMTVVAEQTLRIRQIVDVLNVIDAAIAAPAALPSSAELAPPPAPNIVSPAIGNGEQRQQSLSLFGRARQALQSFATTGVTTAVQYATQPVAALGEAIENGAKTVVQAAWRVGENLNTQLDQSNVAAAEIAYQNDEGKATIQALTTRAEDHRPSIAENNGDVRAQKHFRDALGDVPEDIRSSEAPTLQYIRRQLHMGENIARALVASEEPTIGTVVCPVNGTRVTAIANLTTVRALAWYFDSAADSPQSANAPSAPSVQRTTDGSLLIDDPDSHLYDFLMHAPTAHTVHMVKPEQQQNPKELAVFRLHDYHAGFPRGSRGMQFERTVNQDTGAFVLRMRFLKEPSPFGLQPTSIPFSHDDHIAQRERAIENSPNLFKHSVLSPENHQRLAKEDLPTLRAYYLAELDRQISLRKAGYRQLEHLESWKNPRFQRNLA